MCHDTYVLHTARDSNVESTLYVDREKDGKYRASRLLYLSLF